MKLIRLVLFLFLIAFTSLAENYCLDFDGNNDYVTTGSGLVNLDNNMTVEAWFNTTNSTGFNSIATIEKNAAGVIDFLQILTNSEGKVYLDDSNDATIIITNESYNDGKWHHVAFVRNASMKTIFLYVDGVFKGSSTYTQSGVFDPDMELRFGNSEYLGGAYQMDGLLDEIRIWNDVRTVSEIRQNMHGELSNFAGEPNLVAYYKFNEGSGTTLTDSKGSNNGTLVNMDSSDWGLSNSMMTPPGNALDFDGENDYVGVPDNEIYNVSKFTTEMWFRWGGSGSDVGFLLGKAFEQFEIHTGGAAGVNALRFIPTSGLWLDTPENSIVPNQWHHLAFSYNPEISEAKAYIDGKNVTLTLKSGILNSPIVDTAYPFLIGKRVDDIDLYFNGMIDEVRIWNDVRTEQEILVNMNSELIGIEEGLITYYNFNSRTGDTLYDLTTNVNDGTLHNMADNDWVTRNNLPTSADNSITAIEDTDYTEFAGKFSFTDLDDNEQLTKIKITSLPAKGDLYLGTTALTAITEIQLNEISNLKFKADSNEYGTEYTTFKFKVSDGADYSLADYTITIDVTAVNDPPANDDEPTISPYGNIRIGGKVNGTVGTWNDNDDNP
ncbi:MAG: LamG domain-containing protein [Candidatus Delongbacteria bacterium]|nr:LamG domain-containing protein [Candidatus Delongbacteria bacterium]MBN2833735.1 LamG domain-containing protein [Candidatus Delongbacteria bacterium]